MPEVPAIDVDALRAVCAATLRDTPWQYAEDAMLTAVARSRDAQWQARVDALEAALARARELADWFTDCEATEEPQDCDINHAD